MLNMKPYVPSARVAVRESFDEDLSDDIEDDVFIRDGKSIKVRIQLNSTIYSLLYKFSFTRFFVPMAGIRRKRIEATVDGSTTALQ